MKKSLRLAAITGILMAGDISANRIESTPRLDALVQQWDSDAEYGNSTFLGSITPWLVVYRGYFGLKTGNIWGNSPVQPFLPVSPSRPDWGEEAHGDLFNHGYSRAGEFSSRASAVPEPGSLLLLGLGAAALVGLRRRPARA